MPSVSICPVLAGQFFDNDGEPLSGGKIFTYVGGSFTVQKTTYSNYTGTIANSNPIVLDSSGRLTTEVWLVSGENYNIQLTMPNGTTVLQTWTNIQGAGVAGVSQIVAGTNVTISPIGGTGVVTVNSSGGGGGTPANPTSSVQFNNSGAFGGSANFLYDNTNTTLSLGATGATGSMMFDGTDSSINADGDINIYPGADGNVVRIGQPGSSSTINGNTGNNLSITSDQQLILSSSNLGILMGLDIADKISITGPSATQYATGLSNNDLVNKYYVDNNGGGGATGATGPAGATGPQGATGPGGGGGGPITVSTQNSNYTTVLADAETIIRLVAALTDIYYTIDNAVAYPIGTAITFVNNNNQNLFVNITGGGTLVQAQSALTGQRQIVPYGVATAIKLATNYWFINGVGVL